MSRATRSVQSRAKRKKILKLAKGYFGRSKNCYSVAKERVEKGLQYAYRDRRLKKRDMRSMWIQRLNAAARMVGITYSEMISLLKVNNIEINRKYLSQLVVESFDSFKKMVSDLISNQSEIAVSNLSTVKV